MSERTESVSPIRPEEVMDAKRRQIPDPVIEVFNNLITRYYRDGFSCFFQDDVLRRMQKAGLDPEEVIQKGWLDVGDFYRAAGWDVIYDTDTASFNFRPKTGKI